ncbi:hypothetical protein [Pseudomonas fluorescens]|uniref:hypothetical protein n=1 Tax=Pseudomonas fluorescens TaxID=294 RepID=UPI00372CFBB2
MSTEKIRLEFLTWWWHEDQQEMRMSCSQGWALHIWISSRADIEVEWPDQHTYTVPDCAGAAIIDCRTAFNKAVKVKT